MKREEIEAVGFGLLLLALALPLALVGHGVRIVFALVGKAAKRALLWWNAWQFKQSEEEIEHLLSVGLYVSAKAHRERVRQRKLQAQRERINKW